jgi:hypothetical protein
VLTVADLVLYSWLAYANFVVSPLIASMMPQVMQEVGCRILSLHRADHLPSLV